MLCSLSHTDHGPDRGPKGERDVFTFRRKERIRKRKEFDGVYSAGEKRVCSLFVLYWRENNLPNHRLGVSVSKKVGGAVVRNRIKRVFRDAFRQTRFPAGDGVDFVLVARRRMRDVSPEIFAGEYRRLLKSAGFTPDKPRDTK